MAAIGKRAAGAWAEAFDEAAASLTTASPGAVSASENTGWYEVAFILANVVDDDGTLRVVSV